MILTCPNCGTQYVVKDDAIPPEGRQVRCAACKHSWHQDAAVAAEVSPAGEIEAVEEAQSSPETEPASEIEQPAEEESLAEATNIEPRSGPEAEERAYEAAVIEGDAEAPAADEAALAEPQSEIAEPAAVEAPATAAERLRWSPWITRRRAASSRTEGGRVAKSGHAERAHGSCKAQRETISRSIASRTASSDKEPAIQALYVNYVVAMQTVVHPDYLGIASETNLIRLAAPDSLYQAVKHAANTAAPLIISANPNAKLFTTVQVEVAWGRFTSTPIYQGIAQDRADFPFVAVLGLSSYPYLGGFADPDSIPLDYYDRLDDGAPIPMMVIEGGWSSVTVSPTVTSPDMQRRYIERHEAILDQVSAIGWFQITFTDIDLAAIGLPPSAAPFAYLGLVDVNLQSKPALSAWDAVFKRPKR